MRHFAIQYGVLAEAIVKDRRGLNTAATLANCQPIFNALGVERAIAVSHFYHLPRIKLTGQRQGLVIATVPAKETRTLAALPCNMAREVAAWWWYYLRDLV